MSEELKTALEALAARVEALEVRAAYQDETIEDLNKMVVEQWARLDQALREAQRLGERVRDLQERGPPDAQDEPPPPHY